MAEEGVAKKRTFRKYAYRGVDLDQLLDLKTDELVQLFHARARRKFERGLKRKVRAAAAPMGPGGGWPGVGGG